LPVADFFAIKSKVRDVLVATLDDDFKVTWGFTTRNTPRVWAYLGNLSWPDGEWATNRSREYAVRMPIVLNAIKARTTPEDAEEWLAGQCEALVTAFDEASDLRELSVITWMIEPVEFGSQPHTDGIEVQAVLAVTITYRANRR
jgi:hypothetical protein